jgi:two-component system, OmpR family, phosphate regulon sensor histidine kinase PhoR
MSPKSLLDDHPLVSLLMSMMDGLVICDEHGYIQLTNNAFRRTFRLSNQPHFDQLPLELREWLKPRLTLSHQRTDELYFEDYGIPRTFLVQIKPLDKGLDGLFGVLLVFHDVSAIRQTERMRRDFVANVSHELRTPLSAIKGYAETLLDGTLQEDPDVAQEFVTVIFKHANRLSTLVEDLLDLSKLETEDFQPELEPIALQPIVERVIGLAFDNAAAKQIRVRQLIPANFPLVLGNMNNLEQVFTNLVDNAIKYTPELGQVNVSAEVITKAGKQWALVTVKDTGIGIEPKHIPRLFERFYRVDKARSRDMGGTGLGLSIVKHIILYHGGEIWVDSQPNEGSAFTFTLLLAPDHTKQEA